KILNILLLTTELIVGCIILIYLIFLITGYPIEGIRSTIHILIISTITLFGGLIIFLINNYLNNKLASSIFLMLIIISIYITDTPHELALGRSLLVLALPIIMTAFLIKPYTSFIMAFFIITINLIICFNYGFFPNYIGLAIYVLIAFVIWFSVINFEKSIEKYREAYQRESFYKDLFAHDTNNILQNILLALELSTNELKISGKLSEKRTFNRVLDQIDRGAHLVWNTRQFSNFNESKKYLDKVDLKKILEEAIENIKLKFERKFINIDFKTSIKNIFVKADKFLFVVFENLLFNSIIHNNNKMVEISILISRVQENGIIFLKVEIIDNGIGIPDSQKQYIFNRDFNGDKNCSGLGLGLLLVKNILLHYKAKFWVENKIPGDYTKGSNFILLFPELV
ncbi:MAG: sensor histidine kinase, partial [Candidatus Thorarchaeota archaeon]